jgi:hypothetical protein
MGCRSDAALSSLNREDNPRATVQTICSATKHRPGTDPPRWVHTMIPPRLSAVGVISLSAEQGDNGIKLDLTVKMPESNDRWTARRQERDHGKTMAAVRQSTSIREV